MAKLSNKVAVITGGNSGIGFATAKLFHAEGAQVIITGRDQGRVDDAVKEIGNRAFGFQSDTSDLTQVSALFEKIQQQFGNIDVLFLNAGIGAFRPITMADETHFDSLFNTNVKGLYFSTQKALPLINKGGAIIYNTSVANQKGMPGASVYSATKAAVRSFVRTLATELAPEGIRINAVSPGPIETPIFSKVGMSEEDIQSLAEQVKQQVVLGRFGQSEEVANAVLFLASNDSSFVTGSEIVVDGGMSQV